MHTMRKIGDFMFLSGSGCVSIGTCYEYFVIFYL